MTDVNEVTVEMVKHAVAPLGEVNLGETLFIRRRVGWHHATYLAVFGTRPAGYLLGLIKLVFEDPTENDIVSEVRLSIGHSTQFTVEEHGTCVT